MNDYNNDQDNMNGNYNQGYGQENDGGYSYNYTPNPSADTNAGRSKAGRNVLAVILSLALILATLIVLTSAGMFMYRVIRNGETSRGDTPTKDGTSSNNISQNYGSDENITIPKPLGTDKDGVTSAGQVYNSLTSVYMAVSDTVVEITTEIVQNSAWMGQYVSTGAGSGVIVHADGYIVTNNHVIDGASNVTVRLTDGSEYNATFVGTDTASDIAVIKIDAKGKELAVAPLGCSKDLVVGEDVAAIGNPLGSLGGTLTEGIISATERQIKIDGNDMVLLQTSAAINPGNSGGGLFNMAGQLIGIVNAKAAGDDIEGLGFAIPIDTAYPLIMDLINHGYVRGIIDHGISCVDVTSQNLYYYRKYGITETGVIVTKSKYCDELKFGDKIISVNDIAISTSEQIEYVLDGCSVGDTVMIKVQRNGKSISVSCVLREHIPEYINFG